MVLVPVYVVQGRHKGHLLFAEHKGAVEQLSSCGAGGCNEDG